MCAKKVIGALQLWSMYMLYMYRCHKTPRLYSTCTLYIYICIEVIHILSVYTWENCKRTDTWRTPASESISVIQKNFCLCMCIICVMYCYMQSDKFISVKYKWFQPNRKMCDLAIIFPNNRNAHSKEWLEGHPNAGIIWSLVQSNPATW